MPDGKEVLKLSDEALSAVIGGGAPGEASDQPKISVVICGIFDQPHTIGVMPSDTIANVKKRVLEKFGNGEEEINAIRLTSGGRTLENECTVGSYGIKNNSNIHALWKLMG
jgi:hypothetical protein